jgi:hypothetical protein
VKKQKMLSVEAAGIGARFNVKRAELARVEAVL